MSNQQKKRTKITVLSMDVEFEGRNKDTGNPYTIFNVVALGEDGQPIEQRLRTFDKDLPRNELIEVEVERRDDQRHGTTYTVSIPGKRGGGLKESVDVLREKVEALERRLEVLERGDKPELQSLATPPPGDATGGPAL